jgi:hypothetical protein
MGFPPGAVYREQGFRTDSLPLRLLSAAAQLQAEVSLLPAAAAGVYRLVGLARSG